MWAKFYHFVSKSVIEHTECGLQDTLPTGANADTKQSKGEKKRNNALNYLKSIYNIYTLIGMAFQFFVNRQLKVPNNTGAKRNN